MILKRRMFNAPTMPATPAPPPPVTTPMPATTPTPNTNTGFMNKVGTGFKKVGNGVKTATPWVAGLGLAGAAMGLHQAAKFMATDHSRE